MYLSLCEFVSLCFMCVGGQVLNCICVGVSASACQFAGGLDCKHWCYCVFIFAVVYLLCSAGMCLLIFLCLCVLHVRV